MQSHCAVAVAISEITSDVHKAAIYFQNPKGQKRGVQQPNVLGLVKHETLVDTVSSLKCVADILWKLFQHLKEKSHQIHDEIRTHQNPTPGGVSTLRHLENRVFEQICDEHYSALDRIRRRRKSPKTSLATSRHPRGLMPARERPNSSRQHAVRRVLPPPHSQGNHNDRPPNNQSGVQQSSFLSQASRHIPQREHEHAAFPPAVGLANQSVEQDSHIHGSEHRIKRQSEQAAAASSSPQNFYRSPSRESLGGECGGTFKKQS